MTLAEIFREEGIKEGMERGMERGMEKGEARALARTVIKLLTRKFDTIPEDLKQEISVLGISTLDAILDGIMDYESLNEVKKHIRQ